MLQRILNFHLLFVNITSYLIRLLVNFSFHSENGRRRIIIFRSSNNHSEIIKSSLSLLKYSVVFLIKFLEKLADKNFFYGFYFKIKIFRYSFSSNGSHQSFTDKNKFIKRNVAVELEAVGDSFDHYVKQSDKAAFHEYLRSFTNIITKNIYTDKDSFFTSLHKLRKNKDIVILSADSIF